MSALKNQLEISRDGRVMTVSINNPSHNFMTANMLRELDDLTQNLENDSNISIVILTGALPGIFMTHYDTPEMVKTASDAPTVENRLAIKFSIAMSNFMWAVPGLPRLVMKTPLRAFLEIKRVHRIFLRMNKMDKIFIAAINGNAGGAGCELALACDLRLMADGDYHISQPEITHGIIPGGGGTQRLAHMIGTARAAQMILMAEELSPHEAKELGLVNEVCSPKQLMPRAQELAQQLSKRSALSIGGIKRAIYVGSARSLPKGHDEESIGFTASVSSEAALETLKAYNEDKGF